MFISRYIYVLLLISTVRCQVAPVTFTAVAANTDIGPCTCDLYPNQCDPSCCCDRLCSTDDKATFGCSSRDNQYTNSTPVVSTIQSSCFKNISIFYSNSPYVIQKMGELVCVDLQRYTGSQYYQQPTTQSLDSSTYIRQINSQYSVSVPSAISSSLTSYQVGTRLLTNRFVNGNPGYFSLPVNIFNNPFCSGSQTITYMNNFISTCTVSVNNKTCSGNLNPNTYLNNFCLIPSPANRNNNATYICYNRTLTTPTFGATSCSNALLALSVTIQYSNPGGIQNVNWTVTIGTANTRVEQKFTVNFISTSISSSSSTTRNPGYRQSANIMIGTANGSTISSSQFTFITSLSNGYCDSTNRGTTIRFGENFRTACKYTLTSSSMCPTLNGLFLPNNPANLYFAAYSDANLQNLTDWLPVISCTSDIGSPNTYECQNGIIRNSVTDTSCYTRLDIQITYTKIGSISNPQSVLSAVVFHYQKLPSSQVTNINRNVIVSESVTFQDVSTGIVTIQGEIPAPNTRLPADFFYPFTTNRGIRSRNLSFFLIICTIIVFSILPFVVC